MRPDGTRVKDLPPLVAAIPYIMPKRYDAWNSVTENIDEEVIKDFIRTHRRAGVRLNHMSVIISAYYKAVLRNPKLNYFVMNGRIYRRNHFCVSFVILKKQADGVVNETTLKVYLDENDTVFTVNQKIKDAIDANKAEHQSNSTDKFARFMFSVPGLPKFVVWLAYHLDKHGLLPRKIIDLSPFHTSMFITNLASIKTSYIHHHCYEFGTTSVFVCMGKPVPNYISGDLTKKMMPIGVVMDERICTGYEYAAFCNDFRRYMRLPRMLEYPFCQEEPAKEAVLAEILAQDLGQYTEIVFCGYGEPTYRLDDILWLVDQLKERFGRRLPPVRINTNGHANLILGRDVVPELKGRIDTLSISLNAVTAAEYTALCHPAQGEAAYQAMLDFAREATRYVPHVVLTIVDKDKSSEEIETCRQIAAELGVKLRIRSFIDS